MTSPALVVPPSGAVHAHCLRLRPGDSLMPSLKQAASVALGRIPRERCGSAFVITAVGSLRDVTLRLANASRTDGDDRDGNDIKRYADQRFEIVSMTGTFSRDDGCHVHISLADADGATVGGHLIDGVIFTTCELVLGTAEGVEFVRKMDDATGYNELEVRQLAPTSAKSVLGVDAKVVLAAALMGIVAWKCRTR
ncbi:hypothetical protein ACHAWF_011200 [Thalassiosira exigua]